MFKVALIFIGRLDMKKGFTLAEVLITLGIIGIVAALTIPYITAGYQKQGTINKLKKSYSIISQAFKTSELDNGESVYWDTSQPKKYFQTYWQPYLNILQICTSDNMCGYNSNTPWYRSNGQPDIIHLILDDYRVSFILSDGTLVSFFTRAGFESETDGSVTDSKSNLILVDINGSIKPNKFGKDVFYFERIDGEGIMPYGYNDNDETINNNCSKKGFGYKCSAKIIRDGWKIKNGYPY